MKMTDSMDQIIDKMARQSLLEKYSVKQTRHLRMMVFRFMGTEQFRVAFDAWYSEKQFELGCYGGMFAFILGQGETTNEEITTTFPEITGDEILTALNHLLEEGYIYEPKPFHYKPV
jgi:hypothetical protein